MLLVSDWNSNEDLERFDIWDGDSVPIKNSNTRLEDVDSAAVAAKMNSSEDDRENGALILGDCEDGNPPEMMSKDEVSCSAWYVSGVSCEGSPLVGNCSSELGVEEGGGYYAFISVVSVERVPLSLTIHRQVMKERHTSGKLRGVLSIKRQSRTEQKRTFYPPEIPRQRLQKVERHRLRPHCCRPA